MLKKLSIEFFETQDLSSTHGKPKLLFYDYSWDFFFLQPIAEGNCVVLNALLIILCRNIVSWSVFVQNSSLAVDNKARVSISIELGEQIFILQVIFYQNDNFFHQFQKVAIQSSWKTLFQWSILNKKSSYFGLLNW